MADYIVLCLDVGPSMSFDPPSGESCPLVTALKIANQIVQQKIFGGCKDHVGLVLFGTPGTDNELAAAQGGYQNISVAWNLAQPSMGFLKYLRDEVKPGEAYADFIDAIVVSMDLIVKGSQSARRVGDKKIYLFTDAGSGYSDDGLDQICSGLQEKGIQLIVIGPDLEDGGDDGDNGDGGHGDGGYGDRGSGSRRDHGRLRDSSVMKKTAQQLEGERVLSRIVQELEGVSFSFREAVQVSSFIHKTAKKQTTRFSGHLEIGTELKIPCKIFTKVMKERPDSWKKLSAISQSSATPGTMGVKVERSYHLNDEDETEVDREDASKGYRYGKSLIPISDADEQAIKFSADRALSVLGFTSMSNVKQHHTLGTSVQLLVSSPGDGNAATALSSLIHALYEVDMACVVRYVWRKNSQPKLMALVPYIKADCECMVMYQLPFMEDVRQYTFASITGSRSQYEPTRDQLNVVDDLITSMDLMEADVDESGETYESLQPKLTFNPIIQRTFQCIEHRAMNPDDPLPDVEPSLLQMIQPRPTLLSRCSEQLEKVTTSFPLKKVEKKVVEGVPSAWQETSELKLDEEPPPPKKLRPGEEETDFSMASIARGEVTEVGTLDPVGDFHKLIGRKDGTSIREIFVQLQTITMKLVKDSFGDVYYNRALECVKVLRIESIKNSEVDMFNSFLRNAKSDLVGTRCGAFWSKICTEGITLVSQSDCSASSVTDEEAQQFITEDQTAEAEASSQDQEDDADDLLAMM